LQTQPHTPEQDRQEVRIRLQLINALLRQYNDDTPIQTQFSAAEAVCRRLNDAYLLAELHAILAVAYILHGRPLRGLPYARAAKEIADAQHDVHLQAITAGPLAHLLWIAGSFTEARQIAEDGLRLMQKHQLAQAQMGFLIHPHAHCLAIAGVCQGFLGAFDRGVSALREAAELTERHHNRISQAIVHWGLALLFDLYDQRERAQAEIAKALSIMEEVSPTTGVLLVGSLHDYLAASTSHDLLALPSSHLMRTWQEQFPFCELAGAWLADISARIGRMENARQLAREALKKAEESASTWFLCVAYLTNGRLLASIADDTKQEAELHLRTAFDLATRMQSLPLLAHAAVELGDLLLKNESIAVISGQSSDTVTTRRQDTQRNQAKRYLQQAIELGKQLEMATLCERAQRLLGESAQ
jgi:tetratricopeptide (TPR) repeat protein